MTTAVNLLGSFFPDVNKSHIATMVTTVGGGKDAKLQDVLTTCIQELKKYAVAHIPAGGATGGNPMGMVSASGQPGLAAAAPAVGLQQMDPTRFILPPGVGGHLGRPLRMPDPAMAGVAQYGHNIRNSRPGPMPGAAAERLNVLHQRDKDLELVKCPSGYCADLSQPPCKEHR
jgi:hypothetical protein